jgi:HD-like signal output (HDOD) protein
MVAAARGGLGSWINVLSTRLRARVNPARKGSHHATGPGERAHDPRHAVPTDVAMRRFTAFAVDGRVHDVSAEPDDPAQIALSRRASAVLEQLELQPKYLPRRPSLLPKLMSAIGSDANSMRDLAQIIGEDGALLGGLLRLANSAFYRVTDKPIESLERAVMMVGTAGIRSLVTTALLHPVMTASRGPFAAFPETIWEHTQFAAAAAEMHGAQIEHVDVFSARLVTLLHGLATNTVFRIVREESVATNIEVRPHTLAWLLEDWVGPTAARIAVNWQLPIEHRTALASRPVENALARSLLFGRLAGAQIVMVKRGRIKEDAARATLLAHEHRRVQIDRLWSKLALAHLR